MKQFICVLLSLMLLLALAACEPPVDGPMENPDASILESVEQTELTLPLEQMQTLPLEQTQDDDLNLLIYQGLYCLETALDSHVLQVRAYNRFLTLEHSLYEDGSLSSFWVEEFWPDEDETFTDMYDPMCGQAQIFSVQPADNHYDGPPLELAIYYNDSGISLQWEGSEIRENYLYSDSLPQPHADQQTLATRLAETEPITVGEGPVGRWHFDTGYYYSVMDLSQDGTFFMLNKAKGEPVEIYNGAWGLTEANTIAILAERLGSGNFPYNCRLRWELDAEGGILDITEEEAFLLYPFEGYGYYYAYNPADAGELSQTTALSYVTEVYGVEDAYEVPGTQTSGYYTYYMPAFLGGSEEVNALNESIAATFGARIEQGLEDMAAGKEPQCSTVLWDQYRMGDILAVLIHAYDSEEALHQVYYYDTAADTRLYARDVLAKLEIDETMYLDGLRNAMQNYYESYHQHIPEAERDAAYEERLAWNLSDDNINADRSFVVNELGEVLVWIPIETEDGLIWDVLFPFGQIEPGSVG